MKTVLALVFLSLAASCYGQSQQAILNFLHSEGIDPSTLVTSNCVGNGNSCSNGGEPCCLSPVFSCQAGQNGGGNICRVVPAHTVHIPIIRQILAAVGVTTQNPIS